METQGFRPIGRREEERFQEIRRRILRLQSGKSLDSMEKVGADTRGQIGASFLSLKALAKGYGTDHETALLLWGTGRREEQIVACFLLPAEELEEKEIRRLLGHCHSAETAEYFGTLTLARTPGMEGTVAAFLREEEPFLQIAALACVGRNRIEKKGATAFPDSYVLGIDAGRITSPYARIVYNRLRAVAERRMC